MFKSVFHEIGNELLIARGMIEIAYKNLEKNQSLDPETKAKLERSLDSMKKMSELLQRAKQDYLYKEAA